jgi:hypothetical protein
MAIYPKPHSDEWFRALDKFNPMQAAATRQVIELAGSHEVCSICGDEPSTDYRLTGELGNDAVGTIRLCGDCRNIRSKMFAEEFEPL